MTPWDAYLGREYPVTLVWDDTSDGSRKKSLAADLSAAGACFYPFFYPFGLWSDSLAWNLTLAALLQTSAARAAAAPLLDVKIAQERLARLETAVSLEIHERNMAALGFGPPNDRYRLGAEAASTGWVCPTCKDPKCG